LFNFLYARHHGGTYVLRIEDTDQNRFVEGAEEYIYEALDWCGIPPDEGPREGGAYGPYRQSERQHLYGQYAQQLVETGHAYYAFDTDEDLQAMRERLEASGMKSPGYNYVTREHMKNSLALSQDEVQERLARGDPYVIRIKMPRKEEVRFHDEVRGWVTVATKELDDKILLKSDGMPTYHMANVVDDHLMGITHVIRGEEWLPSTPLHVFMYQSLGWSMPVFAHLPLLLNPNGKGKLSKRHGDEIGFPVFPLESLNQETGERIRGFREAGYLPGALVNFLALMGWHPSGDEELMTRQQLIDRFSLDRVGKSGVKFNYEKLLYFNQVYIREKPREELLAIFKDQLADYGYPIPSDERLYELIDLLQERVQVLHDLIRLSHYFFVRPEQYDEQFKAKKWNEDFVPHIQELSNRLEASEAWTAEALQQIVKQYTKEQNVKMGKLMPMLRLALTGVGEGPGVFEIMAWLGRQEAVERLRIACRQLA
jgi:glutamyl-tRNA synthetase